MNNYKLNNIIETLKKVSNDDFTKKSAKRHLVFLRWIYYKIARENTSFSLQAIGEYIGWNHATVLHGLKKIDDELKDLHLNSIYQRCLKELNFNDDVFYVFDNHYKINSKYVDYLDNIMIIEDGVDVFVLKERKKEIETFKTPENINDVLQDLSEEKLNELYETRLLPFYRMNKKKAS